jgi:hypothetical protein
MDALTHGHGNKYHGINGFAYADRHALGYSHRESHRLPVVHAVLFAIINSHSYGYAFGFTYTDDVRHKNVHPDAQRNGHLQPVIFADHNADRHLLLHAYQDADRNGDGYAHRHPDAYFVSYPHRNPDDYADDHGNTCEYSNPHAFIHPDPYPYQHGNRHSD